jgi:hypothetical protein
VEAGPRIIITETAARVVVVVIRFLKALQLVALELLIKVFRAGLLLMEFNLQVKQLGAAAAGQAKLGKTEDIKLVEREAMEFLLL